MEWFKLSKQRPAVRPEVPAAVVGQLGAEELAAQLAAMPTAKAPAMANPKAVFDNPKEMRPIVRSAPPAKTGFTISSSKDGKTDEFELTSPTLTVAKARMLFKSGWRVHVTNAAGRQFAPSEFDQILKFD